MDDDYAAVNLTLTLPANTATGSLVIPFTAVLDTVAEPAGETVNIASSLLNLAENGPDLAIPGVTATLTINDAPASGDTAPTFGTATIEAQFYTQGTAITPLTLPAATGGEAPIAYTLTPAIPGLTFNPTTRVLTGTPLTVGVTETTYTVGDTDDNIAASDTDTLTFTITVEAPDTAPTFGTATIEAQFYTQGTAITPLTLPAATGGNAPIAYTLTAIPGLRFNASNRVLTGTPLTAGVTQVTYTVGDTDDNIAASDTDTLTFTITVQPADIAPTFGGATVSAQTYTVNLPITPLTLPPAIGGNGAITYALAPAATPAGLTFNAATRVLSGTPTTVAAATDYTYTAGDTDGSPAGTDETTLTFSITIEANTAPAFASTTRLDYSDIAQNRMVTPITLPAATGGNGATVYTLAALPAGLTFNAATRVIAGTPQAIVAEMDYTYTAADSDGDTLSTDEATLIVRFEVIQTPPTEIRLSVNPAAVTESSAATTITVTATLIEGSYATARNITFASTDGTATLNTDYTAVPDTTLTIPANAASAGVDIMFTANVDTNAEAGGETVRITGTLFDGDGTTPITSISVTPATLTINDYVLTVSAGADRTVVHGGTITLNGEVTGGIAIATTWALDSTAATAAFVAAGLTATEAQAEVTRLTAALALITTPVGALPAPAESLGLTGPVLLEFTLTVTDNDAPMGQDGTATDTMIITVNENTTAVTTAINEAILPEVARAMTNSTTGSITRRIGRTVESIALPPVSGFNLAGASMDGQDNLAMAVRTHGEAMNEDSRDIKEMLAGSDFVLPLNAANGGWLDLSSAAFWGSGEYRDFSGESGTLDWDGDLTGFQLGVDARLRDELLVGVAVSSLSTEMDYDDDTEGAQGDYELDMTSVHPYIGWRAGELDLWATVGYGSGDLEITEQNAGGVSQTPQSGDVNLLTIGGGGSGMLWQGDLGQGGTTTLRLKGEVSQTQLEVKGGDAFAEQEIDATGMRIALEAGRSHTLDGGGVFEPSLEIAARYDGGDGETGGGAEVGGALRYRNPATGLTADGRIRALVGQGGNYEEWGISGTLRVAPGVDGQGVSFSLSPGYGNSGSGVQELWRQGLAADENNATDETADYAMKLDARIGYGLGFALNEHHGILTPYGEMTHGTTDSYRVGVNWKAGKRFDLTLFSERRENTANPPEHAVLLKGEVRF